MPPPFLGEMVLPVSRHPDTRLSSPPRWCLRNFHGDLSYGGGGVEDAKVHSQNGLGS